VRRAIAIMLLIAAILFSGVARAGGEEGPPWFKQTFLDVREDLTDAKKANRRLMLYFYQGACADCAKFLRETLMRRALADKTRRYFDVVAVDLRGSREVIDLSGQAMSEKAFAAAMDVQQTPTFLMYDENGRIALRLSGFQPPPRFDAALDYVVSSAYRSYPQFEQYLVSRMAAPMLQGEVGGTVR
jgi:thioredoxin-related protein